MDGKLKSLMGKLLAMSALDDIDFEEDDNCSVDMPELPDFLEGAFNVYRTKNFIVKQVLSVDFDEAVGTHTISYDTFYERTKERERQFDECFADRSLPNGRRVPAMAYVRQYIK